MPDQQANTSHKAEKKAGLLRSLLSATIGLIGYGAWAWYANSGYGEAAALKAAITQGSYSFSITLVLTLLMEYLYRRSQSVLLTALPTSLMLYISSYTVNYLAGTPEILMTILPGAIISTIYAIAYSLGLSKLYGDSSPNQNG